VGADLLEDFLLGLGLSMGPTVGAVMMGTNPAGPCVVFTLAFMLGASRVRLGGR